MNFKELTLWAMLFGMSAFAFARELHLYLDELAPVETAALLELPLVQYVPLQTAQAPMAEVWQGREAIDLDALMVEALIELESGGDPDMIGGSGERGLMQIMPGTWSETTLRTFGMELPFHEAFNPNLNRMVGKAYLEYLRVFLSRYQSSLRSDPRLLLFAAYNGGPNLVADAGFDLKRLPLAVQSYAERASHLHDDSVARAIGVPLETASLLLVD